MNNQEEIIINREEIVKNRIHIKDLQRIVIKLADKVNKER